MADFHINDDILNEQAFLWKMSARLLDAAESVTSFLRISFSDLSDLHDMTIWLQNRYQLSLILK